MSISPTIRYTDARGYEYVETSDWLKQVCMLLPCFEALQWPDYASKVVRDVIDGQDVVIQLWPSSAPTTDFLAPTGSREGQAVAQEALMRRHNWG